MNYCSFHFHGDSELTDWSSQTGAQAWSASVLACNEREARKSRYRRLATDGCAPVRLRSSLELTVCGSCAAAGLGNVDLSAGCRTSAVPGLESSYRSPRQRPCSGLRMLDPYRPNRCRLWLSYRARCNVALPAAAAG